MRCAGLAVPALALIVAHAGAQRARDDTGFSWSKQLRAGSTVTIRNGDGPVELREVSGDRIEVRAMKIVGSRGSIRDVAFDVRESDAGVTVCTVYGRQTSCRGNQATSSSTRVRVEYTVLIPPGISADVVTRSGDVTVRFTSTPSVGEMSFRSGTGNVSVALPADFVGRIDARTSSGSLRSDFEMTVLGRFGAHALQATIGHGGGPTLHLQTGRGHVDLRKN